MARTQKDQRARYGSGGLWQRGRIFWVRYREVARDAGGVVTYRQHRESTKSEDRGYAEGFLRQRLQALGGRRPSAVDPKRVSYEAVRENYLAHCAAAGRRSLKKDRSGRTTIDALPPLDRFFAGWRASEISVADLKRLRAEVKRNGAGDKRANRCMATLRAALRQAVKDEMLTARELPGYFPMTPEPNVAVGAVFVERPWYRALRERLREPLRSAFTLAYNTSIRVGEMARLRWRDVELKKRIVVLPAEITKTGRRREAPLPRDFDMKPGKPDQLVFPGLGDRREAWRAACIGVGAGHYECKECGTQCKGRMCPAHGRRPERSLRYRGLLLRHTRHTFVRNASDAGLPEARIMAITGHATRSMFDRYNIGRERDVELARRALEEFHRKKR